MNTMIAKTDRDISLIDPHGGVLVNRMHQGKVDAAKHQSLPRITLTDEQYMDVEQIAIGTFSPVEGFLGKDDLESVLMHMRLVPRTANDGKGIVWPIPLVLDVGDEEAGALPQRGEIALTDRSGALVALLHLEEQYRYDKEKFAKLMYGTLDTRHPGVRDVLKLKPIFLGGKITLLKRREAPYKAYELTPQEARTIFKERGWSRIVGFHTRNAPHRAHEFIQLDALARTNGDGLFVHPVIGKKKPGDFTPLPIIKTYELMMERFYPKDKVVFATYATFSRYAGPREALFTALCRKNFGCSHFIVGRDHTGVGEFYSPNASHEIFDQFPDIGIVPVKFNHVFYSTRLKRHVHAEAGSASYPKEEQAHIEGGEARRMFLRGEIPPEWFMRREISKVILNLIAEGEEVFVKDA